MDEISQKVLGQVTSSPKVLQELENLGPVNRKNLKTEHMMEFVPTPEMLKFVRCIFLPNSGTDIQDWITRADISETILRGWLDSHEFVDWITGETSRRLSFYRLEWIKTGLVKMKNDVKTWDTMGKLFFPKGLDRTAPEKGSAREALEKEVRDLLESKNGNSISK